MHKYVKIYWYKRSQTSQIPGNLLVTIWHDKDSDKHRVAGYDVTFRGFLAHKKQVTYNHTKGYFNIKGYSGLNIKSERQQTVLIKINLLIMVFPNSARGIHDVSISRSLYRPRLVLFLWCATDDVMRLPAGYARRPSARILFEFT